MMKKIFAVLLLAAMLLCSFAAFAEAPKAEIKGEIVNGSYVIHIPDEEGDLGWLADDMAQADSVVKLARAELAGQEFIVQYDPTGDGEVSVGVRHYTGIACDRYHTWDLSVKEGAVTEVTGGSYTASPDAETFDPYMIGEFNSADGMAVMTITRNEGGRAWDVEIDGASSHGGYVFKTTAYYDCEMNRFVYDKGKTWDTPITDDDAPAELGEAKAAGQTGAFFFTGDPEDMILTWMREEDAENTVDFQRTDALVKVDYGNSERFLKEDLAGAMKLIREKIAGWKGVELHSIRYAGDENSNEENLDRAKRLDEKYTQCALFKTNFHTPAESDDLSMELDTEYEDYEWLLAREDGGNWTVVDQGYC